MNITILTYGSRGDVQPFLPLSLGLLKRGHFVKLAAPGRFKDLVEGYGISFVPLAGDPEELSRRLNDAGYDFVKLLRELFKHAVQIGAEVAHQTEEACASADLIIHTFTHAVGAHTLAREMNIPDIHIQTFPMFTPTGDYPNIALPNLKLRFLNRLTHIVSQRITSWTSRLGYEQIRRQTGLPKRKLYSPFDEDSLRSPTPILCAWSPSILPHSSDWKSNVHVTGYFFFDENMAYEPPAELRSFLSAGEPPVCVSFGSMIHRDAERIDEIIRDALKRSKQRAVILSGWGSVHRTSTSDVLYLDAVPHDWLLPHCKMLIHHGGAGTTSAGLRAGIPQVVVPFMADQPFWGKRIHAIGVGSYPLLVKNISTDQLMQAMVESESQAVCEQARLVSQFVRKDAGVLLAIDIIEKVGLKL